MHIYIYISYMYIGMHIGKDYPWDWAPRTWGKWASKPAGFCGTGFFPQTYPSMVDMSNMLSFRPKITWSSKIGLYGLGFLIFFILFWSLVGPPRTSFSTFFAPSLPISHFFCQLGWKSLGFSRFQALHGVLAQREAWVGEASHGRNVGVIPVRKMVNDGS